MISLKNIPRLKTRALFLRLFALLCYAPLASNAQGCGFMAGDGCVNTDYGNYGFNSNNDPATIEYDNIVIPCHSTLYRNASGTFTVFGESIGNAGTTSAHVAPQILNSTNYPALGTHKVLKVAGGSYGGLKSQFIALTTDGLYAWGIPGGVLPTSLKSTNVFGKVGATSGNTYSLPNGVMPSDVKMLTASNAGGSTKGALVLTTCSGEVWVLAGDATVRGIGSNSGTSDVWAQVLTNSFTPLTGILAARVHGNTVIALRNDNTLWTWGRNTYLGSSTNPANRTLAYQMTHPSSTKTIKMIGVTGGGELNKTFYVLMTDGNLYSLGANNANQIGDWSSTATVRLSWVQPRYTGTSGQVMNNVKWISPQENDQYYQDINIITTTGQLYAWGTNNSSMIGLTGTATPAMPVGVTTTDKILAVRTGGHLSLLIKENTANFGYVGHSINGSLGNGVNTSVYNNSYTFTNTPVVNICLNTPPAPGGVSGSTLWYRSDIGVTDNSGVEQWDNQASSNYDLLEAAAKPAYNSTSNLINFNPTLGFNAGSSFMQVASMPRDVVISTAHQSSHYVVYKKTATTNPYIYNHSNNTGGVFSIGGGSDKMLAGGRNTTFTAPAMDEIRIQSLQGDASTGGAVETRINGTSVSTTWSGTAPNNAGTQPFNVGVGGSFQVAEIIVFPNNANSANERQKVESYLGLKYGVTLPYNYMASDASVYWNTTTNAGYNNNITGLGRDESSKLYQKQSKSINAGEQVVLGVGGALAESNLDNTNTLTDMQFLTVGDNGLAKTLTVATTGIAGVNSRFAAIWKVQNTNAVGTVRVMWPEGVPSIKLIQSTDAVFNSSDVVTNMAANTQTVGGVTYNYADVVLANGQYFTIGGLVPLPGGVSGSGIWYKANSGVTNNSGVEQWDNQSSSNYNLLQATAARRPTINTTSNLINFNPTVGFDGSNDFLQVASLPFSSVINASNQTSQYVVYKRLSGGSVLYQHSNNTGGVFNIGADPTRFWLMNKASTVTGTQLNEIRLQSMQGAGNTGVADTRINGTTNSTTLTGSLGGNNSNPPFTVGAASSSNFTKTEIAEIIVFPNNTNSANERQKVESYLGLKYGITLPYNYMASNGSVYWNTTSNASFNNNIAGIGRDDLAGLVQKQSKSINTDSQVIMSNGSFAVSNTSNTSAFDVDNQFLIWGDNNQTGLTSLIQTENYVRTNRVWAVKNTGGYSKTTDLLLPTSIKSGDVYLVLNSNSAFSSGTSTLIPLTTVVVVDNVSYYKISLSASQVANDFYFALAEKDNDGDLVGDFADIDDDNDGVLDADEMTCTVGTDLIVNGGFELPVIAANYSLISNTNMIGWQTTASDGLLELWSSAYGLGTPAEGLQQLELNANMPASIYQVLNVQPGDAITWSVKHKGRFSPGVDVAHVKIGGTLATANLVKVMSSPNQAWVTYSGTYHVPNGQFSTVFVIESISTATGTPGAGNLLDDIHVNLYNCVMNDTDGDSIQNHLDLDSDDDGCSDALESGSSSTATSTTVYPTGTDSNGNGLLNVYESTITPGVINYSSNYNTNAIVGSILFCNNPLPIELISFDALLNEKNTVDITWLTSSEINNDYFTIEKSINGFDWNFLAKVKGAGNSVNLIRYYTEDKLPGYGTIYYKLKQTDFNGASTISPIQSVQIGKLSQVQVHPIPFSEGVKINSDNILGNIEIVDLSGNLVYKTFGGQNEMSLDLRFLANGIYFIKLNGETIRIIKHD